MWGLKRQSSATEASVRADLAALPEHIDHVDELIAAGTLDGPELNAADYQIGTSMRVLLECDGVRELDGGPARRGARAPGAARLRARAGERQRAAVSSSKLPQVVRRLPPLSTLVKPASSIMPGRRPAGWSAVFERPSST